MGKNSLKLLEELESRHFEKAVSKDVVERYWAIPKIISKYSKMRILDAGAGDGYISSKLMAMGHNVVAIEIVAINIRHLKERGIAVIPHDLMHVPYPFRDESFDMIICADVLEHLYRPDVCLKEFYRVLKPDGALLVSTPNYAHPYRIWQLIKGNSFHDPFSEYQFYAHIRFFTYKTLKKFLAHYGFHVTEVFLPLPSALTQYQRFTRSSKLLRFFVLKLYPHLFYRISPRFCDEPILVCRKTRSKLKVYLLNRNIH